MITDKERESQVKNKLRMPTNPEYEEAETIYATDKTSLPFDKPTRKKTDEPLAGYYVQLFFLS